MKVMRRTVTGSCSLIGELDGDLVLLEGEHLVGDLGEEVALLRVLVAELLDPALDGAVAEDRAGLEIGAAERLGEVVLVDLLVAGELDRLDVGPLAHEDAQVHAVVLAGEVDLDVLEVAGVPHLADVLRQPLGGERSARAHLLQIARDVFGRDAAVAREDDLRDGLAPGELGLGGRERDLGRRNRLGRQGRGRRRRHDGRRLPRRGRPRRARGVRAAWRRRACSRRARLGEGAEGDDLEGHEHRDHRGAEPEGERSWGDGGRAQSRRHPVAQRGDGLKAGALFRRSRAHRRHTAALSQRHVSTRRSGQSGGAEAGSEHATSEAGAPPGH